MTFLFFFFNDTATTEIYTLSLHDALPIFNRDLDSLRRVIGHRMGEAHRELHAERLDRKSTRLNSSHDQISYAVFCLKKKNHDGARPPMRLQSDIRHVSRSVGLCSRPAARA